MARQPVKQFRVGSRAAGDDFDKAEIEALIYKIALWFGSPECDRQYADPIESAQQMVQECLLAQTKEGKPWTNCPQDFEKRVKAKCSYDMAVGKGIPAPRVKGTANGGRALDRKAQEQAKELGDSVPSLADFDQETFRSNMERDIYDSFPELDNPAHRPNVRSLALYYAQREVIDRDLAANPRASTRETLLKSLKLISDMADDAMKQLGIHPDQVRKKINERTSSTVADLVAHIGDDPDFKHREKVWGLQLALQLYWMSEHHNGRKNGPQMHDWEIWHLTRSRPVQFTCRHGETYTVIEGFTPRDLRAYLVKEGVLVEEPVIPGLIDPRALEGLATEELPHHAHPEDA